MKTQLRNILESAEYLAQRPVESACVDALENFLRSNYADLFTCTSINAATAARWGQPLLYLAEFYSDPFVKKFVEAFSGKASLNEDAFSELQALALMRALGFTRARIVERTSEKTHDFDLSWDDENIEVEVTRAGPKDANLILSQQAEAIANRIYSNSRNFDVIVHISRLLTSGEVDRLISAALHLKTGETKEEKEVWKIVGEEISRAPGVIEFVGESHSLPGWWRRGMCMFHLHAILQSADSMLPTPRVKIYFPVVYDSYLNPARKKAQKFQGTANLPYVVVIDVSNLPGAFTFFENGLEASLPNWKRVSAVLLFENYKAADQVGWTLQLFKNPGANLPLKEGSRGIGDLAKTQLLLPIQFS
jgi:hypothetical protein